MALDKAKTAVLVIDVLVTEGDDTLYNPSPEEERVVVNSARVVDAARAAGMPVIFCDDAHILGGMLIPGSGEKSECDTSVLNFYHGNVIGNIHVFFHNQRGCAGFKCLRDKIMSVRLVAGNTDKKISLGNLSRIHTDSGYGNFIRSLK